MDAEKAKSSRSSRRAHRDRVWGATHCPDDVLCTAPAPCGSELAGQFPGSRIPAILVAFKLQLHCQRHVFRAQLKRVWRPMQGLLKGPLCELHQGCQELANESR
jgi:hypothetical protein